MYREILRQIERDGYGARPGRAAVPRRRKLWVAATRGFSDLTVTGSVCPGARVLGGDPAPATDGCGRRAGGAGAGRVRGRRAVAAAATTSGDAARSAGRRRSPRPTPPPELPRRRARAAARAPRRRLLRRAAGGRARRAGHRLARQRRAAARAPGAGRTSARRGPVLPALELIAVIANADPGEDGMYRTRQPDAVIRRYLRAARRHKMLLVLDIQPGRSDFFTETTRLRRWLREPDVGLALDPEWHVAAPAGPGPGDRHGRLARGQRDLRLARAARRARQPAAEAVHRAPVHERHGRRRAAQAARPASPWSSTPTASAARR